MRLPAPQTPQISENSQRVAKVGLESGDNVVLEISTNGTSWPTLRNHNSNVSSYTQYTANLDPYVGDSTVYLRFRGSMGDTSDNFFVDSIAITNDSAIGYLNGQDGQNTRLAASSPAPASARSTSRR